MVAAVEIENLRDAIRHVEGCESRHIEEVHVHEQLPNGTTVWDGDVQVFELIDHPTASRAYAWSYFINDTSDARKYLVILHDGPVNSPVRAVQAAVMAEWRKMT